MRTNEEVTRPKRFRTLLLAGVFVTALADIPAQAQRPDPGEIRGLKLGLMAKSMTLTGFGDLACGSNGGPPRQKIEEWSEFAKCRPEASGLHEVYIRFDDEDEYIGKAIEEPALRPWQERYPGGRPSRDSVGAVRSRRNAAGVAVHHRSARRVP